MTRQRDIVLREAERSHVELLSNGASETVDAATFVVVGHDDDRLGQGLANFELVLVAHALPECDYVADPLDRFAKLLVDARRVRLGEGSQVHRLGRGRVIVANQILE